MMSCANSCLRLALQALVVVLWASEAGAQPAPSRWLDPWGVNAEANRHALHGAQQPPGASVVCPSGPPSAPLLLAEAVERALCQQPRTREAWAAARAAAAELGATRSAYLPQVSAELDFTRTRQRFSGVPDSFATTTKGGGLRMAWVLTDFGRRDARHAQARAVLDAANASHDNTVQRVFLDTLNAYFEALAGESAALASREAEQLALAGLEIVRGRQEGGAVSLADQLQSKAAAAKATANRLAAQANARKQLAALANAAGLAPGAPVRLPRTDNLQWRDDPLPSAEEMANIAAQNHPLLVNARAERQAAEQRRQAALAEGRPVLTVSGQQAYTPPPGNNPIVPSRVAAVGVQLSVPLFQGFEPRYKAQAAAAEIEARSAGVEALERQIRLEVWRAHLDWEASVAQRQAATDLLQTATQSEQLAQERYRQGVGGILDWLNARSVQDDARLASVRADTEVRASRFRLAASTGRLGLWMLR